MRTESQREKTYGGQGGTGWLALERGLIHAEGVVLRRGRNRRRGGIVVGVSAIARCGALEVVSVVKTLLRGLGAEGEGCDLSGDVRSGGAGHDGFARGGISGG